MTASSNPDEVADEAELPLRSASERPLRGCRAGAAGAPAGRRVARGREGKGTFLRGTAEVAAANVRRAWRREPFSCSRPSGGADLRFIVTRKEGIGVGGQS